MTEAIEFDDVPDSDLQEEFELDELVFPYATPQQWVVLHPKVTPDELAVYTFVMAHVNPHSEKFAAYPGRKRIAERFGKSLDWVDKKLNALVKIGAISKRHTYWRNRFDHSQGRSTDPVDEKGVRRAQAPNRYTVHLRPPSRERHPGPIKISEYYRPDRLQARVASFGGELPVDQESPKGKTPGEGGAAA